MLVTEMIKFCHTRNVIDTTTVENTFQTSSRYYQHYLTVKASPQHTCCRLGLVIHDDQVVFCLNPRLVIDDYDFGFVKTLVLIITN